MTVIPTSDYLSVQELNANTTMWRKARKDGAGSCQKRQLYAQQQLQLAYEAPLIIIVLRYLSGIRLGENLHQRHVLAAQSLAFDADHVFALDLLHALGPLQLR